MTLAEIIKNCGVISLKGNGKVQISSLVNDSRKAGPGSLFIAVNGCGNDGRAYIPAAVQAGAAAIMMEEDAGYDIPENVCVVTVSDSRHAVAMAADAFYGHPSGKLKLVGITGTNGKTTTVTLLYRLFRSLGYECGLLSTIANYVGDRRIETSNTTSDPVTINSLMDEMCRRGCEYCFMEVSSIGVEQKRIEGLEFKLGIFSNLTHDHLDYHGTFAEYLRCKKEFFDRLPADAVAIINADDRNGSVMVQNCKAELMTYGCRSAADHKCRMVEESFEGMQLNIDGKEVWTRLIGAHNAYNILAIYCAALALGVDSEEALLAISALESAPGRLETIHGPKSLSVVIDFGCGGDRDRTKRPEMGAVAEKYADRIILTSDNSRSESTTEIINEIKAGMSPAGLAKSLCIEDRREAIRTAIMLAPQGSAILLAGKGHETYQIMGNCKSHFDEREIVEETFKTLA